MRILVAHHSALVLEGLATALRDGLADVEVSATTHLDELRAWNSEQPEALVVLDVALDAQVVRLCEGLGRRGTPVVVLTHWQETDHLALLEAGVQGVVTASDGLDGLLSAARTVLHGNMFVPAHLLGSVLHDLIVRGRERADSGVDRLSPREREVLALLGIGADHHEIAERLFISPHTAKTHITRLIAKLGVRSRIEAAALAVAHDIEPTSLEVVGE